MSEDMHAVPPSADFQNISHNLRGRVIQDGSPQQDFSILLVLHREWRKIYCF